MTDIFDNETTIENIAARQRDDHWLASNVKIPPRCYSGEAPHEWQDFGTKEKSRIECGPCGLVKR